MVGDIGRDLTWSWTLLSTPAAGLCLSCRHFQDPALCVPEAKEEGVAGAHRSQCLGRRHKKGRETGTHQRPTRTQRHRGDARVEERRDRKRRRRRRRRKRRSGLPQRWFRPEQINQSLNRSRSPSAMPGGRGASTITCSWNQREVDAQSVSPVHPANYSWRG